MTSYSVLPNASGKATIIATWPSADADSHSAKVTTVPITSDDLPGQVADELTRISEGAWHAAAWLDTYPVIEAASAYYVHELRKPDASESDRPMGLRAWNPQGKLDGLRDATSAITEDLRYDLQALPSVTNQLTRAQRLSLADELEADAAGRREALALLPAGSEPATPDSRAWQTAGIGRATLMGLTGSIPGGGPGWIARLYDVDRDPVERWAARTTLTRLVQLRDAARAHGGRGNVYDGVDGGHYGAHLVFDLDALGITIRRSADDPSDDLPDEADDDAVDEAMRRRTPDEVHLAPVPAAFAGSELAEVYRSHAKAVGVTAYGLHPLMYATVTIAPGLDDRTPPWERDPSAPLLVTVSLPGVANGHVTGGDTVIATVPAADTETLAAVLGRWATTGYFRA